MPASSTTPARQRWLVPVLVAVVALTVGGGLLVRELYRQPLNAQTRSNVIATPSATPLRLDQQPGARTVDMTPDASAHPEDEAVRALLQTYFDAINDRSYERWKTTVSADRARTKTESVWLDEYGSTRDGSIIVYRIESAPDENLQVLVGFTSTQDLVDAPPDLQEECIRWRLALPVVREGGQWKVDTVPTRSVPEQMACD
ncbi:hypothetical protein CFN78_26490 [Amycolatopsis antarctica]|uniref:Uncharacterized protein n=1 Tax=Amycolatopsis antarctica TaxID=1854586 RepID=A0A263CXY8_9PSEU|nr:hypothetical protein [Amycolatopsis antarctica]OZM70287.1 hypothetical protein CFN78_26490 [Amycolatopsis antarctica]